MYLNKIFPDVIEYAAQEIFFTNYIFIYISIHELHLMVICNLQWNIVDL